MILQPITSIEFARYGALIDMTAPTDGGRKVNFGAGDGYKDAHTDLPVIDTPASLGMTIGDALPARFDAMERHFHTQEALFGAEEPIAFLLSVAGDEGPHADDVVAVTLPPGMLAVLDRGVWHSAARGLSRPTRYFYLAHCYADEPTEWRAIAGGPVSLEAPDR